MARLKTTILLGALTGLFLLVGYLIGGQQGALMAFLLSLAMNAGTYWFSDTLVLRMYRAREIPEGEDPGLHAIVRGITARAGMPMPKLYEVDLPVPNAFATGRNPQHAAVAVSRSLRQALTDDELRGVLAHELSHVKNRDILVSTIAATLAGALSFLAQLAYFSGISGGYRRQENRGGLDGVGALLLVLLSPILAMILNLAVSRSREYLADASGAELTGQPLALAEALKKITAYRRVQPLVASPGAEATAHLFIINPFKPSFLLSLFSTHPPIEERIARLEEMARPKPKKMDIRV